MENRSTHFMLNMPYTVCSFFSNPKLHDVNATQSTGRCSEVVSAKMCALIRLSLKYNLKHKSKNISIYNQKNKISRQAEFRYSQYAYCTIHQHTHTHTYTHTDRAAQVLWVSLGEGGGGGNGMLLEMIYTRVDVRTKKD